MQLTAQQGRLNIYLHVLRLGRDLQVICGGGDSHIGAVALAAPESGQVQTRLLALPGHKEDALALRMAQHMAQELHCAVCVSAGIHYDTITREEIQQVEQMVQGLTQDCISALKKDSSCLL